MAFYGNITNTANTNFQFDKIYANRVEMEENCENDGVFIGRHVLIEYDKRASYPLAFSNDFSQTKEVYLYSSANCEESTKIKYGNEKDAISEGEYVQVQTDEAVYFYKCVGKKETYALFDLSSDSDYIINYNIDKEKYQTNARGYDSTVWIKTSVGETNGITIKYVQIADLNSVVPTFDVVADAPTAEPLTPHFDADSTNVYYKLHLQSPYGIELGDVEFNKEGFDEKAPSQKEGEDKITLTPTGKSEGFDNKYAHYDGEKGDILKLNINLPSVGNAVSKVYDVLYGENRKNPNNSLQGILNSFESIEEGEILKKNDGKITGYALETEDGGPISVTHSDYNKKVIIGHAYSPTGIDDSDENTVSGDILNTYRYSFDEHGHKQVETTIANTLPYGYKYIKAGNTTSSATSTQDTYEIASGNAISIKSANKKATISHATYGSQTTSAEEGEVQLLDSIASDDYGHFKEASLSTLAVLPQSTNNGNTLITGLSFGKVGKNVFLYSQTMTAEKLPVISDLTGKVDTFEESLNNSFQAAVERIRQLEERVAALDGGSGDQGEIEGGDTSGGSGDSGGSTEKETYIDEGNNILVATIYSNGDATTNVSESNLSIADLSSENEEGYIKTLDSSSFYFQINDGVLNGKKVQFIGTIKTNSSTSEYPNLTINTTTCTPDITENGYEYNVITEEIDGSIYFSAPGGEITWSKFAVIDSSSGGEEENPGEDIDIAEEDLLDEDNNVSIQALIEGNGLTIDTSDAGYSLISNSIRSKDGSPITVKIKEKAFRNISNAPMHIIACLFGDSTSMKKGSILCDTLSTQAGYFYGTYYGDSYTNGNEDFELYSSDGIIGFMLFKADDLSMQVKSSYTWQEIYGTTISTTDPVDISSETVATISENEIVFKNGYTSVYLIYPYGTNGLANFQTKPNGTIITGTEIDLSSQDLPDEFSIPNVIEITGKQDLGAIYLYGSTYDDANVPGNFMKVLFDCCESIYLTDSSGVEYKMLSDYSFVSQTNGAIKYNIIHPDNSIDLQSGFKLNAKISNPVSASFWGSQGGLKITVNSAAQAVSSITQDNIVSYRYCNELNLKKGDELQISSYADSIICNYCKKLKEEEDNA